MTTENVYEPCIVKFSVLERGLASEATGELCNREKPPPSAALASLRPEERGTGRARPTPVPPNFSVPGGRARLREGGGGGGGGFPRPPRRTTPRPRPVSERARGDDAVSRTEGGRPAHPPH